MLAGRLAPRSLGPRLSLRSSLAALGIDAGVCHHSSPGFARQSLAALSGTRASCANQLPGWTPDPCDSAWNPWRPAERSEAGLEGTAFPRRTERARPGCRDHRERHLLLERRAKRAVRDGRVRLRGPYPRERQRPRISRAAGTSGPRAFDVFAGDVSETAASGPRAFETVAVTGLATLASGPRTFESDLPAGPGGGSPDGGHSPGSPRLRLRRRADRPAPAASGGSHPPWPSVHGRRRRGSGRRSRRS